MCEDTGPGCHGDTPQPTFLLHGPPPGSRAGTSWWGGGEGGQGHGAPAPSAFLQRLLGCSPRKGAVRGSQGRRQGRPAWERVPCQAGGGTKVPTRDMRGPWGCREASSPAGEELWPCGGILRAAWGRCVHAEGDGGLLRGLQRRRQPHGAWGGGTPRETRSWGAEGGLSDAEEGGLSWRGGLRVGAGKGGVCGGGDGDVGMGALASGVWRQQALLVEDALLEWNFLNGGESGGEGRPVRSLPEL